MHSDRPLPEPPFASDVVEHFGRFPIRTELTVLAADNPNARTFTVQTYQGSEISRLVNGRLDETPLCRRDDLRVGMAIIATTLCGQVEAIVEQDEEGELYWRASKHLTGNLEFDTDDRHCWTSSAAYNTRGLVKFDE